MKNREKEETEYIEKHTQGWDEDTLQRFIWNVKEDFNLLWEGYKTAEKEFKKKIKDKYNHYNSELKQATQPKLGKNNNTEYIIKLESKVELLRSLI